MRTREIQRILRDATPTLRDIAQSAGVSYSVVSASVTYVGQIDSDVLPDGAGAYDVDVYGMLSVAYDF